MTTANCPRCSEQVSVPDSASRDATVRCPFCQDEYSLGEALAQLPPSLIVLADFGEAPASISAEDDSSWAALNLDDDDADEVAMSPMDDASPLAAFDFASGPATAEGKSKAAIRPSSRPRKPQGSPIKSILSIVIGGLLAFPIAQLILWYLPGEWKRDFGAGPYVAQVLPQIVPVKFRGGEANPDSDSGPARQDSSSVIPDFNSGGGQFAEATTNGSDQNANANNKKANNSKKRQKTNDTAILPVEPAAEEAMSTEDAAAAGADVFGAALEVPGIELGGLPLLDTPSSPSELPDAITRTTEEPVAQPSARDDGPLAIEAPQPEVTGLALGKIRKAPQISANDVAASVEAAAGRNLAWDNEEASPPSRTLMREFYSAFSKLGEALTFADRSDEVVAAQVAETTELLHEVRRQSDKLDVIRGAAKGWMAAGHEVRKTDGICLAGVVKSVEPIGNFFETIVESAGQQFAVVSLSDPYEYFAEDRQVLILGAILDEPAKNFGGYEGSRKVVVLDGFHVNISAE